MSPSGALPAAACPYLSVPDGRYRFARPDRDHRCLAVRPVEAPPSERQRRLCLTPHHGTCPAFLAARERRAAALAEAGISLAALESARTRPFVRTTAVVVVGGRSAGIRIHRASSALSSDARRTASRSVSGLATRGGRPTRWASLRGPAVALVALVAALAVLAARLPGGLLPGGLLPGGLSRSPLAAGAPPTLTERSAQPTAQPTVGSGAASVRPSFTPEPTTSPTAPGATPSAAPAASSHATQTYRVKPGDTLTAIAARFGVSVADLQRLNGIKDPRLLQVGQVLRIP